MSQVFEVSRSGYYAWRKPQGTTTKERWLIDLIVEYQRLCKQTYVAFGAGFSAKPAAW